MFQVLRKSDLEIINVYDVQENMGHIQFLVYQEGDWVYEDSSEYDEYDTHD